MDKKTTLVGNLVLLFIVGCWVVPIFLAATLMFRVDELDAKVKRSQDELEIVFRRLNNLEKK